MSEERADWRLNPVAERELAEDRRRARRRRWNAVFLTLASLGLCPLACLGSCYGLSQGGGVYLFVAFASVGAVVVALVRYANDARRTGERRAALKGEFGGVPGWLVEITVFQGEAVSGQDVGTVWFEDDRLYFTGLRTSFGLGPGDAKGRVADGRDVLEPGVDLILPLRVVSPIGPVKLGLRFAAPELASTALASSEWAFRKALREWIADGEGHGPGPPLAPGPDLPPEGSLQRRALLATAAWPALLVLVGAIVGAAGFPEGVPIALLGGLVGTGAILATHFGSPRRHWRALDDRRRLEAYNRGGERDGARGREAPPGPDLGAGGGNPEDGG